MIKKIIEISISLKQPKYYDCCGVNDSHATLFEYCIPAHFKRCARCTLGCDKICVRCTTTKGFTRVHHKLVTLNR